MGVLLRVAVYALALWLATGLVPGLQIEGTGLGFAAIAIILAGVNTVVKPVVKILSLPLIVLSLGLFLLVINALLLQFVVWLSGQLELGLTSAGFGSTFLGAIVVSLVAWIGESLVGD